MRPRIKPSAVLVAKSTDSTEQLRRNEAIIRKAAQVAERESRPFVMVFDKKLYINPSEIDYYIDNGFDVIMPK